MKKRSSHAKVNYFELGSYAFVGIFTSLLAFYFSTSMTAKGKTQTIVQNSGALPTGENPEAPKKRSPVFDKEILNRISDHPELLNQAVESVYEYDSRGKRDPFQPYFGATELTPGAEIGPITFLQRFDLAELKLIGIIWDVTRPKAMILTPAGGVYVVEVNTKIGRNNAYIGAIREGEIVVVEPFDDDGKKSYNTKVIAIGKAD
ncbi:MAG: hypothetical protein A4S09_15435 [Proteobacteria bacterium SG_bin7]|nr:MAG: hypothetical protein A4S09_15435 [Proteobacteria bacterium SG_bin7]